MFQRALAKELKSLVNQYPVVTVVGPRQSGKTTLVQQLFPNKPYVNLEEPDIRQLAQLDPRQFLQRFPEGGILDEIQRVPTLLSYIQAITDQQNKKGLFILTGSHQLELHQALSQSLAGRTALLTLLPMSISELHANHIDLSLDEYLYKGFYPRIYRDELEPTKAYRNYFQTYVERDLRQLIHVKDLTTFHRFIKLCAGRIGQTLNMDNLCNEVGVSGHTIKHWLSILEASYIIFRLPPFFENFGKRVTKSPKLYFNDVGLATYLLDIENLSQLSRDPLRGHLVENLVVLELVKSRLNLGLDPQLYYFRDSHKNEVDVIFKSGQKLIPIEIKSSMTFHKDFLKGIDYFQELVKDRFEKGWVVYTGKEEQLINHINLINFKNSRRIVE